MKVSIITPSYNSEKYIAESISSVLNQTYTNWEMIVIDDFSTDNTKAIVKEFANSDNRIKLVELEKNSGAAIARNRGIELATGRFIAFLDSDDLWLEDFLNKSIYFMVENNYKLVFSSYKRVDDHLNPILNDFIVPDKVCYSDILKTNSISCLTGIYDASKLGKIYMEDVKREDYTLWLKILKKIDFAYGILEPLAMYRIRNNSSSRDKLLMASEQWKVYRHIEKFGFIRSTYYFIFYTINGFKKYYK